MDEIGKFGGVVKKREDYFSDPNFDPRELGGLGKIWGREDEPTREEKMKAIEKGFNEESERQISSMICPICKSSVCRCEEEDD